MKGLVPQLDFSLAQDVRGVYTELWPAPGHSNARLTDDHLNRRDCLAAAALGLNRPIATAAGLRALACGMVFAARSDPDAQRWSGSPQE